ncbi:hypothetical protein PseudUWO311_15635 [Pseudanabaena sp. UWO311]|uniref:hypothetical protein n=1 Tax=Pseudanabaena sp. UWO311 TaxID=2487337 RepID=UPI001157EEDC|nr:hypothetical protein [Pseudanabaena sp. UWO311]TYQ25446.1 hypothetical protein PseudUWO311_15635 [Pseudanabaena sp. UWO311]
MPFNYIGSFPIPTAILPAKLRDLLDPVGFDPQQKVEVACLFESDPHGSNVEHVQLHTALVLEGEDEPVGLLYEATRGGIVEYGTPIDVRGCAAEFSPSISGLDYIIASWGDGSFFSFHLAEKVWMTLGLTPRCVGNDQQRLIYDDLGLPEFGVVEGEISSEYYWESKRNVSWKMTNEYLRKYLWLRGARAVRIFFYMKLLPDRAALRDLMRGQSHIVLKPSEGSAWYSLDIREHKDGLLIQVWSSVEAATCELCPEQSANGLVWPGSTEPMTHTRANALVEINPVFLDDKFLQRYEENAFYDTVPSQPYGDWHCSPAYKGQWSFTDCVRVGRNLIKVPMRELYKPKPDREIIHAHAFALSEVEISHFDINAEHIVAKTKRLLDQLLWLGDNLSRLGASVGLQKTASELVGFSREQLYANGWMVYPNLCRLAQVAPLNMTQQAFLARCKSLHEVWQKVPNGYLKKLLEQAGCPRDAVKDLGLIKLLQSLTNIVQLLNRHEEPIDDFRSPHVREGWSDRNNAMAPLFLNNDLRITDAHESVSECLNTLQTMGFDIAHVNDGYGLALDFVMDGVIEALRFFNSAAEALLNR